MGFATEPFFDATHTIHDVIAFSFTLCVACTMALELANERRHRVVTWLVVLFGAASLSLQVAQAYGFIGSSAAGRSLVLRLLERLVAGRKSARARGCVAHGDLDSPRGHRDRPGKERSSPRLPAPWSPSLGVLSKSDLFTVGVLAAGAVFLGISPCVADNVQTGRDLSGDVGNLALLCLPLLAVGAIPLAPVARSCGS